MKYFIVSDIHSCYTKLINALNEKGFDKDNVEHTLIVAGDVFDRGNETLKVYEFLSSLERVILIRGNHEYLYKYLLESKLPSCIDFSNGTVKTFCDIADLGFDDSHFYTGISCSLYTDNKLIDQWTEIVDKVKNSPVTKWLFGPHWVNYVEIGNYIITHAFIPMKYKGSKGGYDTYIPDWRTSEDVDWEDAVWYNPCNMYYCNMFSEEASNGKTLICGHTATAHFHTVLNHEKNLNFNIFYGANIVGIDGRAFGDLGQLNVLIIDGGIIVK